MDKPGRSRSRNRRLPESRSRCQRNNRSPNKRSHGGKHSHSRSRDRSPEPRRSRSHSRSFTPRYRRSRNRRSSDRHSRGRRSCSYSRSRSSHVKRVRSRRSASRGRRSQRCDSRDCRSRDRGCRRDRYSPYRATNVNRRERSSRSVRTPSLSPLQINCDSLNTVLSRLEALERRSHAPVSIEPAAGPGTEQIVEAIHSLKSVGTSHYYVSNFDPSIHDVDTWFGEVDRAKLANEWNDHECLSRIGNCLKGDAKSWLNEWVSNDRTWTNFKIDFKPLCIKRIDSAGVLFEVMLTNSDKYRTYAEYARKSLLRLRIVKGLSDDLITEIVLRGITDPQVKATATNANLKPVDMVNYLSTFVKPSKTTAVDTSKRTNHHFTVDRDKSQSQGFKKVLTKCYSCGESGHRQISCPKRPKTSANTDSGSKPSSSENRPVSSEITCTYCKKPGHDIKSCFAKQRADEQRNNK